MDELYPGWDGLVAGVARLRTEVVAPLAAGQAAAYRRWDWARDTYGERRDLGVPPLLIVEGVGAGAAPGASLLIWMDAPEEVRYRRAMDRDGATYAPYWARWAAQERAHFAADRTFDRADVRAHNELTTAPRSPRTALQSARDLRAVRLAAINA